MAWASFGAAQTPVDKWLQDDTPALPVSGKAVEWKFAHPAPPVSHLPPVWQKGLDWLARKTNGELSIKMYGSGSLYGMTGGFKALRAGVADMGTCYTVAEAKGFELFKTFQLPFTAPSNPYLTARIINELMADGLSEEFTRRGVYPAHVMPVRPLTLMSKTPIRKPEDLKGKKVVSFMNAPGAAQDLGYSQVRIPFPEIYSALQQGVVDAVVWVDMGFIPFKIYEQAKYYTELDIAPATMETCMNRRSFDRLDKPVKQLVHDFHQKIALAVVQRTEDFAKSAHETLRAEGVEIIKFNQEQKQLWREAFAPAVERWLDKCSDAGKDCRALVKKIDKLANKYSKLSNTELMQMAIEQPVQGIIKF
jgi:TRAP-type C4-dicarboxylate transport system substrate-binding protein